MNISGERNHHRCRNGYCRRQAPGRFIQGRRTEIEHDDASSRFRSLQTNAWSDELAFLRIFAAMIPVFTGGCFITDGHSAAQSPVPRARCIGKDIFEESGAHIISVIVTNFSKNHSRPEKRTRQRRPLRRCATIFRIIMLNTFLEERERQGTEKKHYSLLS